MADDQSTSGQRQPSERLQELADKHGGMSPGMTSPDSTQAALSTETGEPDPEAQGDRPRGIADGAAMRALGGNAQGDEPVGDEDGR